MPLIIFLFYRALWATWRIRVYENPEFSRMKAAGEPIVFAHWHGDELAILNLLKPYKACAMVSTSDDGAIMDAVIRLMGARTSRGSSTRGGVSALKGILRLSAEGWRPSVAVDGPKGPIHKVKPGVLEISRSTGGAIVPLGAHASPKYIFHKAWNKTYLPLPFARVQVVFEQPIPAISRDQDARSYQLALALEQALGDAHQKARNLIATF